MRADFAELLAARPPGSALWVRGLGRSMVPLLRGGDSLRVLRCSASGVRPGDIALLRRPDGGLTAHMVDSVSPLSTSSFLGRHDAPGLEVLGRVVAIRSRGVVVPLPRGSRQVLRALHAAARAASGAKLARGLAPVLAWLSTSPATAGLRARLLGEVEVRRLLPGDLLALLVFADELRFLASSDFLARQLSGSWQAQGMAAGAFDARGRMVGFAYLDQYTQEGLALDGRWIRALVVAPRARGLGVAARLVERLGEHARALGAPAMLADVDAANARSLHLFRRLGFVRAEAVAEAQARAVLEEARPGVRWLVLERRIDAGG